MILYEKDEINFESFGIGYLKDAITARVVEELNSGFELEMTYPITGAYYNELKQRRIILAKPNMADRPQPFRIYSISKPLKGVVQVNAEHISYDTNDIPVKPFKSEEIKDGIEPTGPAGISGALSEMMSKCIVPTRFNIINELGNAKEGINSTFPRPLRNALLSDDDNSIKKVYKAEFKFDRFNIHACLRRGKDTGFEIRYGKNLTSLNDDQNSDKFYTGIYPFYFNQNSGGSVKSEKVYKKVYIADQDLKGNDYTSATRPQPLSNTWFSNEFSSGKGGKSFVAKSSKIVVICNDGREEYSQYKGHYYLVSNPTIDVNSNTIISEYVDITPEDVSVESRPAITPFKTLDDLKAAYPPNDVIASKEQGEAVYVELDSNSTVSNYQIQNGIVYLEDPSQSNYQRIKYLDLTGQLDDENEEDTSSSIEMQYTKVYIAKKDEKGVAYTNENKPEALSRLFFSKEQGGNSFNVDITAKAVVICDDTDQEARLYKGHYYIFKAVAIGADGVSIAKYVDVTPKDITGLIEPGPENPECATLEELKEKYPPNDIPTSAVQANASDKETIRKKLAKKVEKYIEDEELGPNHVASCIKVSFIKNYDKDSEYAQLENVEIGDEVTVIYDALGVREKMKVHKTEYDPIANKYNSIELGEKKRTISDSYVSKGDGISNLSNDSRYQTETQVKDKVTDGVTEAPLSNAQKEELERGNVNIDGAIQESQDIIDKLVAQLIVADSAVIKNVLKAGIVEIAGALSIKQGGSISLGEDNLGNPVFGVDENGHCIAKSIDIQNGSIAIRDANNNVKFGVDQDGNCYAASFNDGTNIHWPENYVKQELNKTEDVLNGLGITNYNVSYGIASLGLIYAEDMEDPSKLCLYIQNLRAEKGTIAGMEITSESLTYTINNNEILSITKRNCMSINSYYSANGNKNNAYSRINITNNAGINAENIKVNKSLILMDKVYVYDDPYNSGLYNPYEHHLALIRPGYRKSGNVVFNDPVLQVVRYNTQTHEILDQNACSLTELIYVVNDYLSKG